MCPTNGDMYALKSYSNGIDMQGEEKADPMHNMKERTRGKGERKTTAKMFG